MPYLNKSQNNKLSPENIIHIQNKIKNNTTHVRGDIIDRPVKLTKEEAYLDSLYRPRKKNSRKQLLTFFVYKIIVENATSKWKLNQADIIEILKKRPYEITIERKALSRVIHRLSEDEMGVCYDPIKGGIWYDWDKDEYSINYKIDD